MAFDFPASPSVGQLYPTAPLQGQPVYRWDGTLWTTKGVTRPPLDQRTLWTDGSRAMTAELTLAGDPVNPSHASDRHYADLTMASIAPPAGSVRYDTVQTLTAPQIGQAQANMGTVNAFPVGATMVFYQAAAPVGWTQVTTQNDKALRVVSGGTGGSAGGSNPFSTVFAQTAIGNHTLAVSEMPAGIASSGGTNQYVYFGGGLPTTGIYENIPWSNKGWATPYQDLTHTGAVLEFGPQIPRASGSANYISYAYGAATFTNLASTNTGGGAHNHPVTMNIAYCDIIIAAKN